MAGSHRRQADEGPLLPRLRPTGNLSTVLDEQIGMPSLLNQTSQEAHVTSVQKPERLSGPNSVARRHPHDENAETFIDRRGESSNPQTVLYCEISPSVSGRTVLGAGPEKQLFRNVSLTYSPTELDQALTSDPAMLFLDQNPRMIASRRI